jgi:hypothetical protein
MLKSTTIRHAFLPDRQDRAVADLLHDSEQPLDSMLDFSICGGRQHPLQAPEIHPEQTASPGVERESETQTPIEDFFPAKPAQDTRQSRQALDVASQLRLQGHGSKQTGEKSPFWAFEHRIWRHRRDRAEGRNHGVQGR